MLFREVAILGVGLIGGSLGAAIRRSDAAGKVVGIGRRIEALEEARRLGCVDSFTTDARAGVSQAELVVLATPVSLIPEKAAEIIGSVPRGAVIIDVGSAKKLIASKLDATCAGRARYVGCHPMAGSEKQGVANASPDLFARALCIVTPTPHTDPPALERVEGLWRTVGARTLRMSPEEHDRRVALASHLPHVAAACLMNIQSDGSLEVAASGFSDATRIAASDARLWRDICLDNADEIIAAVDALSAELSALRSLLAEARSGGAAGAQRLFDRLDAASRRRRAWGERRRS